jgi:copper chaperone CopZ
MEAEGMVDVVERTYRVEGMTCEHCELSVRDEVEELVGVHSAVADRSSGRLTVRGESVDDAAVRAAVADAGYRVPA